MKPGDVALVMVDVQRDFWRPLASEPRLGAFPGNVRKLLEAARGSGFTVLHTQACFKPDRSDWMPFYRPEGRGAIPCIEGTPGALFEEFAAPLPGEPVILKRGFDGFAGTDLEKVLREKGASVVLLAGLETSVCVLFTATSAYLRGFIPVVVADACGDEQERHEATLRMYDGLCFKTATTRTVAEDFGSLERLVEPFTGPG